MPTTRRYRKPRELTPEEVGFNAVVNMALAFAMLGVRKAADLFIEFLYRWRAKLEDVLRHKRHCSRYDAEDAVGEAFLNLYEELLTKGFVSPCLDWFTHMYVRAGNRLSELQRQAKRVTPLAPSEEEILAIVARAKDFDSRFRVYRRLLGGLTRTQRRVLAARLRGVPHREIATRLEITPDVSRALMTKALRKIGKVA